jgi:hypothetical protein
MSERSELIARKETVRARLVQLQRELERSRLQPHAGKQVRRLEEQIEQLMAEEQQLRQAIDQSPQAPA